MDSNRNIRYNERQGNQLGNNNTNIENINSFTDEEGYVNYYGSDSHSEVNNFIQNTRQSSPIRNAVNAAIARRSQNRNRNEIENNNNINNNHERINVTNGIQRPLNNQNNPHRNTQNPPDLNRRNNIPIRRGNNREYIPSVNFNSTELGGQSNVNIETEHNLGTEQGSGTFLVEHPGGTGATILHSQVRPDGTQIASQASVQELHGRGYVISSMEMENGPNRYRTRSTFYFRNFPRK